MKRILLVCHSLERVKEFIERGVAIANSLDAAITLIFIYEVELFNFFNKERPHDKADLWKQLKGYFSEFGRENAVVLVEEGDSADWVELELEKESSSLVVIDYLESVTATVVKRVSVPCLVLKRFSHKYNSALIATEISQPKECLEFAKNFASKITLYMDKLVVPIPYATAPIGDALGGVVDIKVYEEILEQKQEELKSFCQESSLECSFKSGDDTLENNILTVASQKGADLLILSYIDSMTQLGSVVSEILDRATTDILICQRGVE